MNVPSQGPDLEVLLDASAIATMPETARSVRPRGWLVVGIALTALLLGWFAFPVRSALARSVVRQLEGHWIEAEALDRGRFAILSDLAVAAAPGDEDRVRAGTASLYREEVGRLRTIRSDLHAELVADPALSRIRAAMIHAAADESADLDQVANWYSTTPVPFGLPPPDRSLATVAAINRADVLLGSELRRLALSPRHPAQTARYTSADPVLAALSRIADRPTGTRLVVSSRTGPVLVDIDANVINPTPAGQDGTVGSLTVLARRGYVVLGGQNGNQAFWAVPPDLQGRPRPLGNAVEAIPAVEPDGVWLHRPDDSTVELGGQGNVLAGPVPLPAGATLGAATDAGLVLMSPDARTVSVWDPATRKTVRIVTTQSGAPFVAAGRDTIVWLQDTGGGNFDRVVHLTSASTGRDRSVVAPSNAQPCGSGWSISPDGTRVASIWCASPPGGDFFPAIIDLTSGRVDLGPVTTSAPEPSHVEWSSRGDRIFITNSPDLLTYEVGSATVEHLRLRHVDVLACAVVAS